MLVYLGFYQHLTCVILNAFNRSFANFPFVLFRHQKYKQSDESENINKCEKEVSELKKQEDAIDVLIRQRQMELEHLSENNSKYPFF